MKIAVVGTGYVGLVTGSCLADVGMDVTCVDVDAKKIANLHKGVLPIYEPGLDEIVERNVKAGRLKFTTTLREAVEGAEADVNGKRVAVGNGKLMRRIDAFATCWPLPRRSAKR